MAAILFLIYLKLACVELVRNIPGQSAYNPIEHVIVPLSLVLIVLAACKDKPKEKIIKSKIRKYRSVKKFAEEFKDTRLEYVSTYVQTMETPCSLIEDAYSRTRYTSNNIK